LKDNPVVRAALLGTILQVLFASAVAGQQPASPLPVLAVDRLTEGTVVENHVDALSHWVQRGFKGAVLLHIDAHDDLRSVDDEKIVVLKGFRDRGDLASLTRAGRGGEGALFDEGSFVRAAAALGIVREVIWVVPFVLQMDAAAGDRLKDYLGKAGFSATDIATFRAVEGCYRGLVGALPVALCAQERLPGIGEPVLLSLDADYLPHAARYRGVTLLTEIKALIAALRDARYTVRDAVVAHSVQGGSVPVELRWAGEAIVDILRDPSIALQQEPPERWSALQRLSTLKAGGRAKEGEMLNVALSLLQRQPHDPSVLLFAAEAAASHGGGSAALAYAEQACQLDRGYCVGLREVGLQLLERGAVDDAEKFFAAGERLLPGMAYGRLDEGILLATAGRTAAAVATLEKLIALDGAFPGAFLAGAIHVASGDRTAARRSYDAALAALARSPYASVTRAEVAGAISGAAIFYRDEGLVAQAELLERDPRLRLPPAGAAP
jgi:hypothetical protein